MAEYISSPLDVDAADLESEVYEYIQTHYEDFEPREGHLSVVLTETFMQHVADARTLTTDVSPSIFRYFGSLIGVEPVQAAPATGLFNVVANDSAGHTYEAPMTIRLQTSTPGVYVAFETEEDVVIEAGSNTASNVAFVAVEDGVIGNGLTGVAELLTIEDTILSITAIGSTAGGTNEEDEDTFLDKLRERLQLLADRPILPRDFEIFTQVMFPDVTRALALDLYDPVSNTFGNEKYITVVPIDASGLSVPSLHASIKDLLESVREVNFVVNVMAPTYTAVTVTATVKAHANVDVASLKLDVEQAVQDYLSPASWGQPGFGDERRWVVEGSDIVRFPEIMTVINNVEGVNYIVNDQITINGNVNTNLTLAGRAPLPAANPTVTITVQPAS